MAPVRGKGGKVHLRLRNGTDKTACGLVNHDSPLTRTPAKVTCLSCLKTVALADAEVRSNNKAPRWRTRKGKNR